MLAGYHLALVRELPEKRHPVVEGHQQLRRPAAREDDAVEVTGADVVPVRGHDEVVAPPLLTDRDDGLALALGRARGLDAAAAARQRPERHVRLVVIHVFLHGASRGGKNSSAWETNEQGSYYDRPKLRCARPWRVHVPVCSATRAMSPLCISVYIQKTKSENLSPVSLISFKRSRSLSNSSKLTLPVASYC
jgi:hypothetical protein